MQRLMPRRGFLKRSLAALGGLTAALSLPVAASANPERRPYYILDPEHGAGDGCPVDPETRHRSSHRCHGCQACHSHGANKLFATLEAADQGRAHPHCQCLRREGGMLPHSTWTALFGPTHNPHTLSADRRDPKTQNILRRVA